MTCIGIPSAWLAQCLRAALYQVTSSERLAEACRLWWICRTPPIFSRRCERENSRLLGFQSYRMAPAIACDPIYRGRRFSHEVIRRPSRSKCFRSLDRVKERYREPHSRVHHGANITVLQYQSPLLRPFADSDIYHGTSQVVGANNAVREQHPKDGVDPAQ